MPGGRLAPMSAGSAKRRPRVSQGLRRSFPCRGTAHALSPRSRCGLTLWRLGHRLQAAQHRRRMDKDLQDRVRKARIAQVVQALGAAVHAGHAGRPRGLDVRRPELLGLVELALRAGSDRRGIGIAVRVAWLHPTSGQPASFMLRDHLPRQLTRPAGMAPFTLTSLSAVYLAMLPLPAAALSSYRSHFSC